MDAIFQYSDIDSYETRKIRIPVEIPMSFRLIGSANGLICVSPLYDNYCCFIWNPCTAECKVISVGDSSVGNRIFGFGYDSISDDYKVVGYWDGHLYFFSLKTNSWKRAKDKYSFRCKPRKSALDSNGALHWCVDSHIVAFDLTKEKTFSMTLPKDISCDPGNFDIPLFEYQGSLCAYSRKSIWVMKEYGNVSSWTQLRISMPEQQAIPVGISRVGQVVFCAEGGDGLVKSDVWGRLTYAKSKRVRCVQAFVYKESLISPECFDARR